MLNDHRYDFSFSRAAFAFWVIKMETFFISCSIVLVRRLRKPDFKHKSRSSAGDPLRSRIIHVRSGWGFSVFKLFLSSTIIDKSGTKTDLNDDADDVPV